MISLINNKKEFRKIIRSCNTLQDLCILFDEINNYRMPSGNGLTLYIKNRYQIKIEDVWLSDKYGITCYFHTSGQVGFKSIKEFSYRVQLIESYNYKSFSYSYTD